MSGELPTRAEQHLETKRAERGLQTTSILEYRRDLADFCRWLAGRLRKDPDDLIDADLAGFDRDGARRWLAHLAARELGPSTRASMRHLLRGNLLAATAHT